jgi:hypothetical protein
MYIKVMFGNIPYNSRSWTHIKRDKTRIKNQILSSLDELREKLEDIIKITFLEYNLEFEMCSQSWMESVTMNWP